MDEQSIQIFLTVMRTLSFSEAANQLYMPQSTVSNKILELERQINAPLFYRGKGQRKTILTETGEKFVPLLLPHFFSLSSYNTLSPSCPHHGANLFSMC